MAELVEVDKVLGLDKEEVPLWVAQGKDKKDSDQGLVAYSNLVVEFEGIVDISSK